MPDDDSHASSSFRTLFAHASLHLTLSLLALANMFLKKDVAIAKNIKARKQYRSKRAELSEIEKLMVPVLVWSVRLYIFVKTTIPKFQTLQFDCFLRSAAAAKYYLLAYFLSETDRNRLQLQLQL